jgi:endonuclease/exonuclease/phosphatase family metal-dependent hydrolase
VHAASDSFPGGSLTVVTFNVLHGFAGGAGEATLEERLSALVSALVELRPDVAILQEVSLTPADRHGSIANRILAGLSAAGEAWSMAVAMAHGSPLVSFYEGSAILSRYRILSSETLAYRAQSLFPPERRIALRVLIQAENGALEVIGTHLTNRAQRIRDAQARQLVERFVRDGGGSGPLLIGGDFNCPPAGDAVRELIAAGLSDAWAAAGRGAGYTALAGEVDDPEARLTERIDYLFTAGEGVRIEGVELFLDAPRITGPEEGRLLWVSDHAGVVARLRLAGN